MSDEPPVTFGRDDKFDLQLSKALIAERRLAEIFVAGDIERIELKTEEFQWEQTGNICIEFMWSDRPSGISVTKAGYWVHELRRGDDTLVYLMFPIDRLKALARQAIRDGHSRTGSGDHGKSTVVNIPLKDILK